MELKTCSHCVMDETISNIRFDEKGICQYCSMHSFMEKRYPADAKTREKNLKNLVEVIKTSGRHNKYDVVCGVSGGRDSTWSLYNSVRLGLRPLAVHFDNGWNSEIAVKNIRNKTEKLGVDLETVVADWDEFKDIQLAFLKASVPDVEIPTDVAIHGTLHRIAAQENIKYIFFGHSFRTEGIVPYSWSFIDGKYIESVHKKWGTKPMKDFHQHNFKMKDFFKYSFIKKIKSIPFLNYFDYNQKEVSAFLIQELGWSYYGGHHHESTYTHFIQSYLLPKKFNIDKRKIEYSALIRSGQLSRDAALLELKTPYPTDEKLLDYILNKFSLSKKQWQEIWDRPVKSFRDYATYHPTLQRMRWIIYGLTKIKIVPELLYLKYLGA